MTTLATEHLFVLGILPRSGTNFLLNLLRLHPQCNCVKNNKNPELKIKEDYLLYHADLLVRYSNTVCNYWKQYWKHSRKQPVPIDEGIKEELYKELGNGLIAYLRKHYCDDCDSSKIVATKTPQVRNLKYFFKFFPKAKLIILVRDGRAVAESHVKSFNYSYERAIQHWAEAAKTIVEFEQEYKDTHFKYLIVRYEDLLDNFEEEISRVFKYLDIEAELYDFDAAKKMPILGSSQFWKSNNEEFYKPGWKRVEKTPDFNPKDNWSHWTKSLHERFNWIAGDYMVKFGYVEKHNNSTQFQAILKHKVLDQRWHIRKKIKSSIYNLEKNFYAMYLYNQYFRSFVTKE